MNTLTEVVRELSDHEGIIKTLSKKKAVSLSGCSDSQKINIAQGLSDGFKYKIIATYSDLRVKAIAEDLKIYGDNVLFYPAKDLIARLERNISVLSSSSCPRGDLIR